MPCILGMESATRICSVALAQSDKVVVLRESTKANAHAENISVFIQEVINESGLSFSDIDAVAVSMGPGSYTGLRIGVSSAKGICYASEKPLIAVNTLQAMAFGVSRLKNEDALYCPMIDARRMEAYVAIFDKDNNQIMETKAEIIVKDSFSEFLKKNKMYFFGDGASKCRELLGYNPNAVFLDDFQPSAKYITSIAMQKYAKKQFEDVAYFEPFYLKDFLAGKPGVKGLK